MILFGSSYCRFPPPPLAWLLVIPFRRPSASCLSAPFRSVLIRFARDMFRLGISIFLGNVLLGYTSFPTSSTARPVFRCSIVHFDLHKALCELTFVSFVNTFSSRSPLSICTVSIALFRQEGNPIFALTSRRQSSFFAGSGDRVVFFPASLLRTLPLPLSAKISACE